MTDPVGSTRSPLTPSASVVIGIIIVYASLAAIITSADASPLGIVLAVVATLTGLSGIFLCSTGAWVIYTRRRSDGDAE